jgi:hypothetical protein
VEFGLEGLPPGLAAAPANQTVRFGTPPRPPGSQTQVFGAVTPPSRQTMRFGAEETASLRTAIQAEHANRTQTFGAVSKPAPPSANPTLLFAPASAPATAQAPERRVTHDVPRGQEARGSGARRLWLLAAAMLAVGAIAFFGVKLLHRLRAISPVLISEEQAALRQDRLDDAASRDEVTARLDALAARAPRFLAPRADRALLLALRLDDLRAPLGVIAAETAALDAQIADLTRRKSPSDWSVRVNALEARKSALGQEGARIAEDAKVRQAALDRALAALPRPTGEATLDNLAVVRARGVAAGVAGTGAALELADRYASLAGPGGWASLILAEYALNAHAPPQTVNQVRLELHSLKEKDSSYLRPYVLLARLELAEQHPQEATAELEMVVALNPAHALAHRLLDALHRTAADSRP